MESFIEKFSEISAIEYKRCHELKCGAKYPIECLSNIDTKYGESILATVTDCDDRNRKFRLYLPKRYSKMFTDAELRNIKPNTLSLVYRGKREQTTLVEIIQ